jgi:hypothetical protein
MRCRFKTNLFISLIAGVLALALSSCSVTDQFNSSDSSKTLDSEKTFIDSGVREALQSSLDSLIESSSGSSVFYLYPGSTFGDPVTYLTLSQDESSEEISLFFAVSLRQKSEYKSLKLVSESYELELNLPANQVAESDLGNDSYLYVGSQKIDDEILVLLDFMTSIDEPASLEITFSSEIIYAPLEPPVKRGFQGILLAQKALKMGLVPQK